MLKRCPICKKLAEETFRPFCSKRCADKDLAHWASGTYAIPAYELPDDEPNDETGYEE